MSKQNGNKGRRFDRAFKEEAVRLLQTSGRRQRQIAGDLGISVSALGRWVAELRAEDLLSGPHEDVAKEITRLCQLRLKISHFCRSKISHFEGAVVPPDAVFGGTDLVEL